MHLLKKKYKIKLLHKIYNNQMHVFISNVYLVVLSSTDDNLPL